MAIKAVHEIIQEISPHYAREKKPDSEHTLVYDSSSETLEPVYFFVIDLMENFGLEPVKLVDNFASSPGSGHFAEIGQRATIMQQQGAKILGDVNTVLRSVLNIIYDLKEFKIRLQYYDHLKAKDKGRAEAARLSLKQIWMDKVDVLKGNSGIKAMALGQAGFQTLLDAFLAVKDIKEADKLDLNDRVKRIVVPRIAEFSAWVIESEKELRKRYALEKNYLKSQVSSLKLYTRWAKPYLRAASQLQTKDFGRDPAMVNVFNTLLLELTILGKQKLKLKDLALEGELPSDYKNEKFTGKNIKRDYYSCILVDFRFRGIPQKAGQHYVFGGKAQITFRAYCLNDDEIAKLDQELDKSDLSVALDFVEGTTDESLKQIEEEINYFLEEKDSSEEEKSSDTSNPFLALLGFYNPKSEPKKESSGVSREIIVQKDSWLEGFHLRKLASEKAKETAFKLFDVYKKAHGMPSYT